MRLPGSWWLAVVRRKAQCKTLYMDFRGQMLESGQVVSRRNRALWIMAFKGFLKK